MPTSDTLFTSQPLGKDRIGNLAKKMAIMANINGKKTNHVARKTAIQTLLHADVPPTEVMQLSGHKKIQSLNAYSEVSENQHQSLSNILANIVSRTDDNYVV